MNLIKEEVCCPRLNVEKWDDKLIVWQNKRFIKAQVPTFFHVPLTFGKAITKLIKLVEEAKANVDDNLCLSDHTSKFNMDILLAVDKEIKGANNVILNGNFYSKVYEGDFNETGKWCKDFEEYLRTKELTIKKWYMWYTTCPKCAKKYGKNYVVIIAEV